MRILLFYFSYIYPLYLEAEISSVIVTFIFCY